MNDDKKSSMSDLEELEKRLELSELKYSDFIDNIKVAVFVTDPKSGGKFIEANQEMIRILGADSKEDLLRHRAVDLYSDPNIREELVKEVQKNGFVKDREVEITNFKGKKIWILFSSILKETARGQFFYGSFIDITERKEIENKLRESESVLKKSQEVAHVGSWSLDPKTGKVSWSDEMFRIFGIKNLGESVDIEEIISSVVHPDDKQRVFESAKKAVEKNLPEILEYRVIWPDKSVHHVITLPAESVLDSNGKVIKLTGIVQDITGRKNIELKLIEKLKELKKSQGVAHVGSWTLNLITGETVWSDEAFRIFGMDPNDAKLDIGGVLKFIHPEDKKRVEDISRAAFAGKFPEPFEYRIVRPDNSIRYTHTIPFGEFSPDGKLMVLSGIVQDITDQKKIELDLRDKILELEKMNNFMINRELKMIELKNEIAALKDDMAKNGGIVR